MDSSSKDPNTGLVQYSNGPKLSGLGAVCNLMKMKYPNLSGIQILVSSK